MTTNNKKQNSTRFLKRKIVDSDTHELIGRIYDLGIVEMNFDDYDTLASYPDCKYVFHCGASMRSLVRRVESLNHVGGLLWVDPKTWVANTQVTDRYTWSNVASDVLLMRLISVHDCSLHLVNDIYEYELAPRQCTMRGLQRKGLPDALYGMLAAQREDHEELRHERNSRVHQGWEREHSSCDQSFRMAAWFEHLGQPMKGTDSLGKKVNLNRYMKEALVELQRDHNAALRKLSRRLNEIYDFLQPEFEARFHVKFNDPVNGFGYKQRLARK